MNEKAFHIVFIQFQFQAPTYDTFQHEILEEV